MAQGKEGERRAWQTAHQTRRDSKSTFPRLRKDRQVEGEGVERDGDLREKTPSTGELEKPEKGRIKEG